MLKTALIAAAAGLCAAGAAVASPADGLWQSPTRHGQIEVYECGADICGRVMGGDEFRADPDLRDLKNKDPAQRTRRLKGAVIMTGFHGGPSEWSGGHVYDPQSGGTYAGTVTVVDGDTLHVKGCLMGPLCVTQTWRRVR